MVDTDKGILIEKALFGIFFQIFWGLVPGFVGWVLGIVSWVLGIVSWVSGFVCWVSGFVFWVSGIRQPLQSVERVRARPVCLTQFF